MKIMGIDLGEKRTGVSICDENETIAYPLKVIIEENEKKLIEKIAELAEHNNVLMILIGLAKNMNGSLGERAQKHESFAKKLRSYVKIPVSLWDERQTTKLALRYLTENKTKRKKKKKIVDNIAATLILESFLEYRKNSSKKLD